MLDMDESALLRGLLFGGVTVAVITLVAIGWALVLLFRRREGARPTAASGLDSLRLEANVLLVRADEAVKAADDELGFAFAQFGEERTRDFHATLARARTQLNAAFRLQQSLDDAFPESVQKQREWTLQITALCEAAVAALDNQDRDFAELRGVEVAAPVRLDDVRRGIHSTNERLPAAEATITSLRSSYEAALTASLDSAIVDAAGLISAATEQADAASASVSPTGVNAVADRVRAAEDAVHRANMRLDAVDARAAELAQASVALESLIASTRADLAEARAQRDAAPGPEESRAIGAAISAVDEALASTNAKNPIDSLETIGTAVARLDAALASARSQRERIEHATVALSGTIATVSAQLSEVRAFITVGGRRVRADARTRLASAERELAAAEAAGADPVEALDAARRALTHVRDADALARYDAQR